MNVMIKKKLKKYIVNIEKFYPLFSPNFAIDEIWEYILEDPGNDDSQCLFTDIRLATFISPW